MGRRRGLTYLKRSTFLQPKRRSKPKVSVLEEFDPQNSLSTSSESSKSVPNDSALTDGNSDDLTIAEPLLAVPVTPTVAASNASEKCVPLDTPIMEHQAVSKKRRKKYPLNKTDAFDCENTCKVPKSSLDFTTEQSLVENSLGLSQPANVCESVDYEGGTVKRKRKSSLSGDDSNKVIGVEEKVSLVPKQFRKRKRLCARPKGYQRKSKTQFHQIGPKLDVKKKRKSSLSGDDSSKVIGVEEKVSLVPKQFRKRKRICLRPKGYYRNQCKSKTQFHQIGPKLDVKRKRKSSLSGDDSSKVIGVEGKVSLVPKGFRKRKRICLPRKGHRRKQSKTQFHQIGPKLDMKQNHKSPSSGDNSTKVTGVEKKVSLVPKGFRKWKSICLPRKGYRKKRCKSKTQLPKLDDCHTSELRHLSDAAPSSPVYDDPVYEEPEQQSEHLSKPVQTSEPLYEPEQFIEVGQLFKSEPEQLLEYEQLMDVGQLSTSESEHGASSWRRKTTSPHPSFTVAMSEEEKTVFISLYLTGSPTVKWSVTIDAVNRASVDVHGKRVPSDHQFWSQVTSIIISEADVVRCLSELQTNNVCMGIPDEEFVDLDPVDGIFLPGQGPIQAYREGNFNAVLGNLKYNSTIRHTDCQLLVKGTRCLPCRELREALRHGLYYRKNKSAEVSYKMGNISSEAEMMIKMAQSNTCLKTRVRILEKWISKLTEKSEPLIDRGGEYLNSGDSGCMIELMKECEKEVRNKFTKNSFQRIFFEQQLEYTECEDKSRMKWHPAIIRMCLYINSKSVKAYDGLCAYLALPTPRTLLNYTRNMKYGTGSKIKETEQQISESTRQGLSLTSHESCVGLSHEEVKVYDNNSGELVGSIGLGRVGDENTNQI